MLLNHCTMDPNPERRSQNTLCSAAALLPQLQLNVTPLSKTHPSLIQRLEVCIKKRTLALWQIQQCIFLTQLSGCLGDDPGHLTLQQLQLNSESGNAAISTQARVLKRQSCSKHSAMRCLWAEQSTAFKPTIVQLGILWLQTANLIFRLHRRLSPNSPPADHFMFIPGLDITRRPITLRTNLST